MLGVSSTADVGNFYTGPGAWGFYIRETKNIEETGWYDFEPGGSWGWLYKENSLLSNSLISASIRATEREQ